MKQKIGYISLVVQDYDEVIEFYTNKLRFNLLEDTELGYGKRWVLVAPTGSNETCLLLVKASSPQQKSCVGNQTGSRVFLFWRDYHDMKLRGVIFVEEPREESYGTVVVFEDIYGNK